jgi:hypothetical protein
MSRAVLRWLQTSRGSGVILIVVLLCLWQYSAVYVMDTPTWPVTRIFAAWVDNIIDGSLIKNLLATAVAANAGLLARRRARHRRRPVEEGGRRGQGRIL